MGAYIKCGDYNTNYKYIIFTCIFNYLTYFIDGDLKEILISSKIIDKKKAYRISMHDVIIDIFNYIGIIIISIILYKFKEQKSSTNKQNNKNESNNSLEILLIHNDIKEEINKNISILNLFFILSYWIIIDHVARIIFPLMIFEYCIFELLCLSFLTSILLKTKIYRHQKIGIIINSLSCFIFGLIRFILTTDENKFINKKYKWLIPISIIIYLFIIISTSYIFTKLKFYMDLRFISPTKLLLFYGIIGFIFSTIACIIETSFKCVGVEKELFCWVYLNIENNTNNGINIEIYTYNENNVTNVNNTKSKTDRYIENFFIFIKDFSELYSKDITIEIIIIFIEIIFFYCSLYFDILIINYLTPMHFIFCNLIFIFIAELIDLIKNIISGFNYLSLVDISPYFFSFIGFMIYLELIELNFCKLNYNLRKYINERSLKDIYEDNTNESIISEPESDERDSLINDYVEMPINKKNN